MRLAAFCAMVEAQLVTGSCSPVATPVRQSGRARLEELSALIVRHTAADGMHACELPRVTLIRSSRPTLPMPALYTPSLCLVTQGRKQAVLGALHAFTAGQPPADDQTIVVAKVS